MFENLFFISFSLLENVFPLLSDYDFYKVVV